MDPICHGCDGKRLMDSEDYVFEYGLSGRWEYTHEAFIWNGSIAIRI